MITRPVFHTQQNADAAAAIQNDSIGGITIGARPVIEGRSLIQMLQH